MRLRCVDTAIDDNVITNGGGPRRPLSRATAHVSRSRGMKVVVVGAGSTYTPELIEGVIDRQSTLPIDDLVLLDIDSERLEVVGGLARRMLLYGDWPGRLTLT